MNTDALNNLIRTVSGESSPEHKAIYHLWCALDDIDRGRPRLMDLQLVVTRALEKAARVLEGPK